MCDNIKGTYFYFWYSAAFDILWLVHATLVDQLTIDRKNHQLSINEPLTVNWRTINHEVIFLATVVSNLQN